MEVTIITITPFAMGVVVGAIGATIAWIAIIGGLMAVAAKKKKATSTILRGDSRLN
jgi:hypothetical protein